MEQAAAKVGAHVDDVTWYLTFATVTLSPDLSSVEVDQDLLSPGPKIAVDSTSYRTNLYLDGEEDEEDPAGFEMGTFSGEEHTRGVDWEDDYEEDDVQGPEYDEDTGEEPHARGQPGEAHREGDGQLPPDFQRPDLFVRPQSAPLLDGFLGASKRSMVCS